MLEIRNIVKDYETGSETVHALKGVSIAFRESELVSILGQSGCGKTTLLNIIGGLDQYTSGDLIINGQSTKQYKSADWDIYRNHSVGFIFQSYNLIPHQSVLSNVELALTHFRRIQGGAAGRRAVEALEKVGLGNQLQQAAEPDVRRSDAARCHRTMRLSTTRISCLPTSLPALWTARPAFR